MLNLIGRVVVVAVVFRCVDLAWHHASEKKLAQKAMAKAKDLCPKKQNV